MYTYSDYFDENNKNKPYNDSREELYDWLCVLDMLIEHYIDARANNSEGLIFSRGMKMTEAEVESYYFRHPSERVSLGYDKEFAGEIKTAIEHIDTRSKKTTDDLWLAVKSCTRSDIDMNDAERLALVMALSVELDMKYARLYGYIANEPSTQYPTVGTFLALYETFDPQGAAEAVYGITDNASGTFMRFFLDQSVINEKKRPYLHMPLVLQRPVLAYIQGSNCPNIRYHDASFRHLPESYRQIAKQLAKTEGIIYLECEDSDDALAIEDGLYCIDIDDIGEDESGSEKVRGQITDSRLRGCTLALHCTDVKKLFKIKSMLAIAGKVYIYGEEKMPKELLYLSNGIMATPVTIPLPKTKERLKIWEGLFKEAKLKASDDVSIELFADTYEFSFTRIKEIVWESMLICRSKGTNRIDRQTILSVIFRYNTANFNGLATQVHTAYVWDDIEIADSQKKRLMVACDRYRLKGRIDEQYGVAKKNAYGNGVSVLMYGSPGTGKTMAAQVIANELGLPLYRVDVSQIFSKYIGETQKNLGVIFDEAKKTNVILFFDEADALFAKRTEVGDSNDRYANSETAYLLQKIEEHDGMTILATNLYHNFDAAFVRRITYVARIDSPDEATRLRLWKRILPDTMPIAADVDFEFLAERFELSGSSIKSILHTAAYMAGAKERAITMADVILSLKYELEKLGRIIDSSDFANYGVYLQE